MPSKPKSPEKTIVQTLRPLQQSLDHTPKDLVEERKESGADSRSVRKIEESSFKCAAFILTELLKIERIPRSLNLWKDTVLSSRTILSDTPQRRWKDLRACIMDLDPNRPPSTLAESQALSGKIDQALQDGIRSDPWLAEKRPLTDAMDKLENWHRRLLQKETRVHDHDLIRAIAMRCWLDYLRDRTNDLLDESESPEGVSQDTREDIKETIRKIFFATPFSLAQGMSTPWAPFQEIMLKTEREASPEGVPDDIEAETVFVLPQDPMAWLLPILRAGGQTLRNLARRSKGKAPFGPLPESGTARDMVVSSASEGAFLLLQELLPEKRSQELRNSTLETLQDEVQCLKHVLRIAGPADHPKSPKSLAKIMNLLEGSPSSEDLFDAANALGADYMEEMKAFLQRPLDEAIPKQNEDPNESAAIEAVNAAGLKAHGNFLALMDEDALSLQGRKPIHADDLLRATAAHAWILQLSQAIQKLFLEEEDEESNPEDLLNEVSVALHSILHAASNPEASPMPPPWRGFQLSLFKALQEIGDIDPERRIDHSTLSAPDDPIAWLIPLLEAETACFKALGTQEGSSAPIVQEERNLISCSATQGWIQCIGESFPDDETEEQVSTALEWYRQQVPCLKQAILLGLPQSYPKSLKSLARLERLLRRKRVSHERLLKAVTRLAEDHGEEFAPLFQRALESAPSGSFALPEGTTLH